MLICTSCGKIFEQYSTKTWEEDRGEFWGEPCYEQMSVCPFCGDNYTNAKQCVICGSWIKEEDWNICEDCLNEEFTIDNCLEIGEENPAEIEINGFLASCFTAEEIDKILLEALMNDPDRVKDAIEKYAADDMLYFAEWVGEKWKKQR
ncbi:MAG: hypothetical protein J6V20_01515 [Bacteroidaceae bacterium]|nr:hypothetical protein [Bacteroidaceae bacterium]